MSAENRKSIAVMTSGGDAQGMNAALRAIVRTAIFKGVDVYAIYEGYQGMVDGGDKIRKMDWRSVSGIQEKGGTITGTARCKEFRERKGRLKAAKNLITCGIDRLAVIGGDGSLTGADCFSSEWPDLIAELVQKGEITSETAANHPRLHIVGLVGSIDNDMANTESTIGADSALHRIIEAVDAISCTATSHQRTFIVEVMGRNCGYLALVSAIATGASWVFIPENPPEDKWEECLCDLLKDAKESGRRDNIIIVAEGAIDRKGNPIKCDYVKKVIDEKLHLDSRITVLGHVQRGGAPSAFDRYMSSILGFAAVEELVSGNADKESKLIGVENLRVAKFPLMKSVALTHSLADAIAAKDFTKALKLRGKAFQEMLDTFNILMHAYPQHKKKSRKPLRLGVMNASWPSPGMDTAVRAAVRLGLEKGHTILGIKDGFEGLIEGKIEEMDWMCVEEWTGKAGSTLGSSRKVPGDSDFYNLARNIEEFKIDGLLVIGGWTGYEGAYQLYSQRVNFSTFNLPIILVPASINNNLPGTELSVGADTALNIIVEAIDKIKRSSGISKRVFIVEVMGRYCGFLALLSGLATGAERVYLHEDGISLKDLEKDSSHLARSFKQDRQTALIIRNEMANKVYTTDFICSLFEEEGHDVFDARKTILGPMQQGGTPSPFDRAFATWITSEALETLIKKAKNKEAEAAFMGYENGKGTYHSMSKLMKMTSEEHHRPKEQWWMDLKSIVQILSHLNLEDK